MGMFVDHNYKEICVPKHKCPVCRKVDTFLLSGACDKCLAPIEIKGLKYKGGTVAHFSREIGMPSNCMYDNFRCKHISEKKMKEIYRVLGITKEEILNA